MDTEGGVRGQVGLNFLIWCAEINRQVLIFINGIK